MSPHSDTLRPGTYLQGGKYRLIRFISAGGFGCTYEAEHTLLQARVAIKEFFVSDICNRDGATGRVSVGVTNKTATFDKLRGKFLGEARAVFRLNHPGIVHVSDVFEENGTAYFVMDYIDGCSLADLIRRNGPMDERTALGYMHQVCVALDYVHANARLHLDIKPGNVMVDRNGRAVLIDFGASKQYDTGTGENLSTLLGYTPGFAPPEQMSADVSRFLPATDVYALGATLYNLLTGEAPLSANERSAGERNKPLPATVSDTTRRAVDAAMQLNKTERPQSVRKFAAMLFSAAPQPQPTPQPAPRPAPKPSGNETRPNIPSVDDHEPGTPWYKRYGLAIALAALVALGAAIALFRGCDSDNRQILPPDTIAVDSLVAEIDDTALPAVAAEECTQLTTDVSFPQAPQPSAPAVRGHEQCNHLDLYTVKDGKARFFTVDEWNAVPAGERSGYSVKGVVINRGGVAPFCLALHDSGRAMTREEAVAQYGESVLPSEAQCRAMASDYKAVNRAIKAFGGDNNPAWYYWGKSKDASYAWVVAMAYGFVGTYLETHSSRVRAVAPVPVAPAR